MQPDSQRTRWLATAALATLALTATPSSAHQQWLAPNVFVAEGDSIWVSFDHTFGDQRFQPSSGPSSYYRWWIVGPDGRKRPVPFLFLGKTRTVGEVELDEPGTYRLEAEEASMSWTQIEVDGEKSWYPGPRENFDAAEVVASRVYFSKAQSFVTLGANSRAALTATGDPLEISFEDHPNELTVDREFRVRVLASGAPVPDQEIRIHAEGGSAHDEVAASCNTDKDGACRITLRTPGRFLMVTRTQDDSSAAAAADGTFNSVSVMVEVRPR